MFIWVTAPNYATVEYEYNSYDDLTKITRGDGQSYSMAYDAYRNLNRVDVGGEDLVTYTYNPGTNRLKTMEYVNGSKQNLTYDRFGNVITETWTKGTATEAKYKYFYDASQNLVKTLDILNKKMYNVNRAGENVTSVEEYNVTLNGETVSSKTLVGTLHYSFDGEGKQFRKKYVDANGNEQKYVFEYQDEKNIAVQLPTGIVSHSKSDHLGRKVFDELQLGSGLMNRKFSYHEGVISQNHLDNGKQVSDPQTTLVKQIEFADGRIIEYEYDAEERITRVIDTVDGTYEYVYDEQGQLLTEMRNGDTVSRMTYDDYGNIINKNGVAYTYGGGDNWKDQLTRYGSQTIGSYDDNGNPHSYLGKTLVWEKGRQLKSFGSNTYTYNKDGIRTSKTVNGVKHSYVLDGTNIVKETWGSNTLIPLYDLDNSVCGIKYNNTAYYFYKNLQGDVIAITDASGTVIARYVYDAWGRVLQVTDAHCNSVANDSAHIANINPFRYRGYYYDQETQLYYLQSRYYDPKVGRFINADEPKNLADNCELLNGNLFVYSKNNPINEKDVTGYFWFTTLISWFLGLMIGITVQFLSDFIIWLFEKVVLGNKETFKQRFSLNKIKYEDYVASALGWAFTLINPFARWKWVGLFSGLFVVAGKHTTKALTGNFNPTDLYIDAGAVIIGGIVAHILGWTVQRKLKKVVERIDVNGAVDFLRECASIRFGFEGLGNKFSFALNISPTFLQAICKWLGIQINI